MQIETSLHQRRRAPTAAEYGAIPWLAELTPAERERVKPEIIAGDALPGAARDA